MYNERRLLVAQNVAALAVKTIYSQYQQVNDLSLVRFLCLPKPLGLLRQCTFRPCMYLKPLLLACVTQRSHHDSWSCHCMLSLPASSSP
jgi:hypothetical protein